MSKSRKSATRSKGSPKKVRTPAKARIRAKPGAPMAKPKLLSGGNPQIPKGEGDAPVQAYIAAMPGWKRDIGRRLDRLIVRTVPGASWHIWPGGHPVVRLASGREVGVVEAGLEWAVNGAPELSQVYGEAAEA